MQVEEIQSFLSFLQYEKRYSKHTITAYEADLKQFANFCQEEYGFLQLIDIDTDIIRTWLYKLMEEGVQAVTISRKISSLKRFYKFLVQRNLIKANPVSGIIAPKKEKKLPEFVSESKLNKECIEIDHENTADNLLFEVLLQTGIRLSELINLKIKDIDFSKKELKIFGKRSKERIVPISVKLLKDIHKSLENREFDLNDSLFVTKSNRPLYPVYVYRVIKSILSSVTTQKKRSPHVLRHTFATWLLNNGADINSIKELLGHANLSATQIYTHNSFSKLKSIYKQAHPRA